MCGKQDYISGQPAVQKKESQWNLENILNCMIMKMQSIKAQEMHLMSCFEENLWPKMHISGKK